MTALKANSVPAMGEGQPLDDTCRRLCMAPREEVVPVLIFERLLRDAGIDVPERARENLSVLTRAAGEAIHRKLDSVTAAKDPVGELRGLIDFLTTFDNLTSRVPGSPEVSCALPQQTTWKSLPGGLELGISCALGDLQNSSHRRMFDQLTTWDQTMRATRIEHGDQIQNSEVRSVISIIHGEPSEESSRAARALAVNERRRTFERQISLAVGEELTRAVETGLISRDAIERIRGMFVVQIRGNLHPEASHQLTAQVASTVRAAVEQSLREICPSLSLSA